MSAAVPILVRSSRGHEQVSPSALDFAARVERAPRAAGLTLSAALTAALGDLVRQSGATATDAALSDAVRDLQRLRRGQAVDAIHVDASPANVLPLSPMRQRDVPPSPTLTHFAAVRTYPDPAARAVYESLVGLDDHKAALLDELELLLYPDRAQAWAMKHHGGPLRVLNTLSQRVPLVVFHGDVGTGKTALAESVGDALVTRVGSRGAVVHLLKITTSIRGQGLVGQMSDLIGAAFKEAIGFAQSRPTEPVILLLDEADALASSREGEQMHHEDKGGVNTLIQQLDNLRLLDLRLAAFFITNRRGALDPAVRRRAALDLAFDRPGDDARRSILTDRLPELALDATQLADLVRRTGPDGDDNGNVGFTASDVADRLLGNAVRAAYAEDAPLTYEALAEAARRLDPTPPFKDTPV